VRRNPYGDLARLVIDDERNAHCDEHGCRWDVRHLDGLREIFNETPKILNAHTKIKFDSNDTISVLATNKVFGVAKKFLKRP
jgi:hypothetical protein